MFFPGIRSEKLRPFWLTTQKTCRRELSIIEQLCHIFQLGEEPSADYRYAVDKAMTQTDALCMPWFGTYILQLRTALATMPCVVVLPEQNDTNHTVEFISDFNGMYIFIAILRLNCLNSTESMKFSFLVLMGD